MEINSVTYGDILKKIDDIPDGYLDSIVTSPPYWQKRPYPVKSSIWGGAVGCAHSWEEFEQKQIGGKNKKENPPSTRADLALSKSNLRGEKIKSDFCSFCGAWKGVLGLEPNFDLYIEHLLIIFTRLFEKVKSSGSIWVVLGDTYSTERGAPAPGKKKKDIQIFDNFSGRKTIALPDKCLCLIPTRFAAKMTDRGYILRNRIIWYKRNAKPEAGNIGDRCLNDYEEIFFFVKAKSYFYNQLKEEALNGGSRRLRSFWELDIWDIRTEKTYFKHYAPFPREIARRALLSSCPAGGIMLDPFCGIGTALIEAKDQGKNFIGIDFDKRSVEIARERLD